MKWNWGKSLFTAGALFMLMLIVFGYYMFQNDFDLVEKDYYPKALEYQQQINKSQNANELAEKVTMEYHNGVIQFTFPSGFKNESVSGKIYFYRPSEKKGDLIIDIQTDTSGRMDFSAVNLLQGKYIVKIDYSVGGTGYYQEETLFVQR